MIEALSDIIFLFFIAYTFAGIILLVIYPWIKSHSEIESFKSCIGMINISFGFVLLVILITSFLKSKIDNGHYFFSYWRDWLRLIPILLVISILTRRRIRRNILSPFLFSLILILGFYVAASFNNRISY